LLAGFSPVGSVFRLFACCDPFSPFSRDLLGSTYYLQE